MALSTQQKSDIMFYLGWSAKTLIQGSTDYSKIMADRLASLSAESELTIVTWIDKIKALDVALESAICRLTAKRVGDIETNPDEIRELRKERLRLIRELSDTVDIAVRRSGGGNASICV